MFIKRAITEEIKKSLNSGKAIIIYGPRQVGKTTLIQKIKDEIPGNKLLQALKFLYQLFDHRQAKISIIIC